MVRNLLAVELADGLSAAQKDVDLSREPADADLAAFASALAATLGTLSGSKTLNRW